MIEDLATRWPEYFLVLLEDGVPVARAAAVPVGFPTAERPELPDHGWDAALIWAAEDLLSTRETNTLIALEVMVAPGRRGGGLATKALEALKKRASETGMRNLVVPVRPAGKETNPDCPLRTTSLAVAQMDCRVGSRRFSPPRRWTSACTWNRTSGWNTW